MPKSVIHKSKKWTDFMKKLDNQVIAGTFEFEAIHAESGEPIQVTDGRFDIKWKEKKH